MRPAADSDALRSTTPSPAPVTPPASTPTPAGTAPPARAPSSPLPPVAKKPMRPIGPAALKALREKIRSGAYPSDDVVRDGIERLIRRAE